MNQSSNQTVDLTSVVSSFATLELSPSPFNRLPNEILQHILSKVERMVPIKKFTRLQLVDTRWRSVLDNIINKKSLILIICEKRVYSSIKNEIEHKFVGLLDKPMRVLIKPLFLVDGKFYDVKVNNDIKSLFKALPNIQQLYIYCHRTYEIDYQLTEYVKSLGSLKKLYLCGNFGHLPYAIVTRENTFSQLEFFFCNLYLLTNYVHCVTLNFDYVRQLHARNPRWLANVTHLSFTVGLNEQFDQVVHFLREHATYLNVLYVKFCDTTQIMPALFSHLGKLTRLKEIALGPVQFEVFKQAAKAIEDSNFTPLATIATCNLVITDFDSRSVTVDQFTRVLVAIFPRVVKWKFAFVPKAFPLDSFVTQLNQNSNFSISDNTLEEFFESLNVSYF